MTTWKVAAIAVAFQLATFPVFAQGAATKDNAHIYQGGPQTGVPHSMKQVKTAPTTGKSRASGGHHYQGGPKTTVPHHMQDTK